MRLEWVGWLATAVFVSSYFFNRPAQLRRVQAGAALLWVLYGWRIGALPVVVANVVVAGVAVCSSFWPVLRAARRQPAGDAAAEAPGIDLDAAPRN